MTKQELIKWFDNYFNNCYYVTHSDYPKSIFMFYDLKYVRKMKLNKIKGQLSLNNNIVGECLFEVDWKNNYLWCDYDKIWTYLNDNYSNNSGDIQKFIKDRLEYTKINTLTPKGDLFNQPIKLEDNTKMNTLTPLMGSIIRSATLEATHKMKHTKMNILTPGIQYELFLSELEEHTKMNILTPKTMLMSDNFKLDLQ